MEGRYTGGERSAFAQAVREESYCLLRGHFAAGLMDAWNQAFEPLLRDHIEREGHLLNRGAARYYVTLPFDGIFADPAIFADPDILAIVRELAGDDFVMCQLASDTPLAGSDYQDVHRDAPPLFPEWGRETPVFQLAVNFALVDVTADNGPMEVAPRTHMMEKSAALQSLKVGEHTLSPLYMRKGDVLIRDVRALHRGTPNRTSQPRPMIVIGYSRKWLFRPEVSIQIPADTWERLDKEQQSMLRYNRVLGRTEDVTETEVYQSFAY